MKQVLAAIGLVFVLAVDATAQSQAVDPLTLYATGYKSEVIVIERGYDDSACQLAGTAKGEALATFFLDSNLLGEIYGVPNEYADIVNRMWDDYRRNSQEQYIAYDRGSWPSRFGQYIAERRYPSRLLGVKPRFVRDGGVCSKSTTVSDCLLALRDEVAQQHGKSKEALEVNTPEGFELKPHRISTMFENSRADVLSWKVRQFHPSSKEESAVDYTGDLNGRIVKYAGQDKQSIGCWTGTIPDKKIECMIYVKYEGDFEYCRPSGGPVSTY